MTTQDELKRRYKETPIAPGVVIVRNTKTDEFATGTGPNPEGLVNRLKFTLKLGNPTDPILKNPKVLEDYKALGEAAFEFKVLDTLKPKDEPGYDPSEDLKALEKMWSDELTGRGWKRY